MNTLFSVPGETTRAQQVEDYRAHLLDLCEAQCPPAGEAVWLKGIDPTPGMPARLAAARLSLDGQYTPLVAANMIRAAAGESGVEVNVVGPNRVDGLMLGRAAFLVTADASGPEALERVAKVLARLTAMPRDSDGFLIF